MDTYEPTDQDLTRWVGTFETEAEVNRAGYHFGLERPDWKPQVREVVVVRSHGKYRRGVVTKVGRTNAKVALTTPTAAEQARKGYQVFAGEGIGWRTSHKVHRTNSPVRFALVAGAAGAAELVDGSFVENGRTVREATWDPFPSANLSDDERSRLDGERLPAPDRGADEYEAAEKQYQATAEREGYDQV